MQVRAGNGKGPLLFEWDPKTQDIGLVRKDMYYKIHLDEYSYCIREERSKYECKKPESHKQLNH